MNRIAVILLGLILVLVPAVVRAVTGTLTYSVTRGGSVPAIANAGCLVANGGGPTNGSCFNTQVINMDFTGATQSFVGIKGNFDGSVVSTWLSAGGCSPSNPMWYPPSSSNTLEPCSDFQVVADSDGIKSLKMTFTQADLNNGLNIVGMQTATPDGATDLGPIIPGAFYDRYYFKIDPTSLASANDYATSTGTYLVSVGTAYKYPPVNRHIFSGASDVGGVEFDMPEVHVPASDCEDWDNVGSTPGNFYDDYWFPPVWFYGSSYNPGGSCGSGHTFYNIPGYNPSTGYMLIENRVTADTSGNAVACEWVQGTLTQCTSHTYKNALMRASRIRATLEGTDTGLGSSPKPHTLQAPISGWYRNYQLWSCAAWNQGWSYDGSKINVTPAGNANDINPCAGALISSNP